MGFLDKLLGRKQRDAAEGMETAPEPATMPEPDTGDRPQGEEQQPHEQHEGEQ